MCNLELGATLELLCGQYRLAISVSRGLLSLHAISGCDAVSAFNGIGKAKWLSTLEKQEEYMNAMRLLGESLEVTESLFAVIERMVCNLYGMPEESDINIASYKKVCRAKTPEPHQLPPTKDELLQHVKQVNCQSLVWKQAFNTNFEPHSPIGHGWQDDEGRLEIVWMEYKPAPESMLELITCNCQLALCGDDCQCRILSSEYTDLCKCTGNCENVECCENEKDGEEDSDGEEQGDNESENDDETDVDLEDGEDLELFIDDFDNTFLWFSVFA